MAERLLIVEDEETLRESLQRVFQRSGYLVDTTSSAESALEKLELEVYDLVITDIILPGIDGIELLKKARLKQPKVIVLIITAYASVETAVEALRAGAYDYVMKPIIHEEIKKIVSNALHEKALSAENVLLRKQIEQRYDFDHVIGTSQAIQSVIAEIKKVADAKSNILLTGETGTGKELFARAIHYNSKRNNKPFVPINCSAIPETLLESELFGYVKGAFTGAVIPKKGLFEEADGGTIFLDEIGDITLQLQAKLLRVLEDQEIRPLGSTKSRKVDIRLLCATNYDIEGAVANGLFREDLLYRINVVTIKLPPLRERGDDVQLLARHFMKKYAQEIGRTIAELSEEVLKILLAYTWPGNVRELQNVIERAVLIADTDIMLPVHLPESMYRKQDFAGNSIKQHLSIEEYTKEFVKSYQNTCNEQQLADMLGITRKTLWEKRKKWNLKKE
jgi:DNA-binding NtrC family response regulator